MIEPDEGGYSETHLQSLLGAHGVRSHRGGWSAPRWFTEGDILFFYHSKRALPRISHHFLAVQRAQGENDEALKHLWPPMLEALAEEWQLAQKLQGTIFACARVAGSPAVDRSSDEAARAKHWRSRVYASTRDVWVFDSPLPARRFERHVKLSTGGGFTPIHGAAFVGLRDELGKLNRLPAYLADAVPGREGFRGITRENWRIRSCGPSAPRFLNEEQLRAYFLDFLLEEIKDPRTTVYKECRCVEPNSGATPDYFVRVAGTWLPVEAKLSIAVERSLLTQTARYLHVHAFSPLRGRSAGKQCVASACGVCMVVDSKGIYLVDDDSFKAGSTKKPLVSRREIGKRGAGYVRNLLSQYLSA